MSDTAEGGNEKSCTKVRDFFVFLRIFFILHNDIAQGLPPSPVLRHQAQVCEKTKINLVMSEIMLTFAVPK